MSTNHPEPSTFVLIPGGWMGAWAWEPVARGLRALGHEVHALTLPGLDDPAVDASMIGLATHVDYVLDVLEQADLRGALLVGHLYSGIVAGEVADRAPGRVAHTVYVEAFLAHHGQSLLHAYSQYEAERQVERDQIAANGGRWPAPTPADLAQEPDLSAEQQRWLADH